MEKPGSKSLHLQGGALRPSPRDIRMSQWPWARPERRAVCAERCPYGSGRRSAYALLTPFETAEGWLYLATVMDLFSRKIVGWAMRQPVRLTSDFHEVLAETVRAMTSQLPFVFGSADCSDPVPRNAAERRSSSERLVSAPTRSQLFFRNSILARLSPLDISATGCATTTEAVRRAIQNSQESLRGLAKRSGSTRRLSRSGSNARPSLIVRLALRRIIVTFRRHTLLPLDDCFYALQPTIPHLTPVVPASRPPAPWHQPIAGG
ncbi:hypothetical protein ACVIGB_008482 [Bradyrhizobium sp. USDA 4341]